MTERVSSSFARQYEKLRTEFPILSRPEEIIRNGVNNLILDVDLTLATIEGIDELARMNDCFGTVQLLTDLATSGNRLLEDVFTDRLTLIQPNKKDLELLSQMYIDSLTEHALQVVTACQSVGIQVMLISGGFTDALEPLCLHLGLPLSALQANHLIFNPDGTYAGFDQSVPLWHNQGKPLVILEEKSRGSLAGTVAMIGDGEPDRDAGEVCDLFIAYAGVRKDASVAAIAPIVIRCESLSPVFVLATGEEKWEEITRNSPQGTLLLTGIQHILDGDVLLRGEYERLYQEVEQFQR